MCDHCSNQGIENAERIADTAAAPDEMPKTYDPSSVEERLYKKWEERGYFHSEPNPDKPPYTIVIPPPNITGQLHMGHALDETMQDILIRYKRMSGFETLWLPGTDHASIATEVKVVNKLAAEGISKTDIGREGFLKHAWAWKKEYGGRIVTQLRKLGSSCDWERERFTMDDGCSRAVTKVFVDLYKKGLIYRGDRIVNWCPHCKTAISNAEVDFVEQPSNLWHVRYDAPDGSYSIICATTRPETILGDTGIAVNPNDPRYTEIVGKTVVVPIIGREIPIVADEYVEMDFGTGAVKITPSHDPNDFEVGQRTGLPRMCVFTEDGHINELGGKYAGLTTKECRKIFVEDLRQCGALVKIEPYSHNVGTCYRCGTTIEPMVSKQWFVAVKDLAEPAIKAVESGRIRFVPERYAQTYYNWMYNIRDWCISRQLWWGHRIPAYYCDCCGETIVEENAPERCPKCGSTNLHQDADVLDTWFSSGMWPFSTLGWPDKTPELKYYYPTSTLATGYDLIFFWIARMIMFGLYVMGDVPFDTVYIHGMVRDEQGRKMSKSLGNVVNPDDVVKAYGADTMRLYIMFIGDFEKVATWSDDAVKGCKRFLDRVWNLADQVTEEDGVSEKNAPIVHKTIKKVTDDIDTLKMNTAIAALMAMVNEFYSNGLSRGDFEALLLMLSPFAPHMVEELWEQKGFAAKYEGKMAMQCAWPEYDESKTVASSVEMAVQVSGKFKGTIIVPVDSDQDTVVEAAKASEKVAKAIAGMQIVKVIHVKNKLVNLIVKPC